MYILRCPGAPATSTETRLSTRPGRRDVPHRRIQPDVRGRAGEPRHAAHAVRERPVRGSSTGSPTGRRAARELRVVFDAQQAPAPSLETSHRGVRVRFAFRRTADDLIEELVAAEPKPAPHGRVERQPRARAGRRAECRARHLPGVHRLADFRQIKGLMPLTRRKPTSPNPPPASERLASHLQQAETEKRP